MVSPDRGHVFHNRLTHSLKVAQIARRLTEKLINDARELAHHAQLDADASETAALAHDLGHPPHGHIAEEEIDRVARKWDLPDGFEGNAQSFRIVCKLAVGSARDAKTKETIQGLNLTRRSLNGILKYPWMYGENPDKPKKWGAYETEKDIFAWTREESPRLVRTATAEIMDYADDITYAVHDLTDFIAAGKIPIDSLVNEGSPERVSFYESVFRRRPEWNARKDDLIMRMDRVFSLFAIDRRYVGGLKQQQDLWRLTSILISRFIKEVRLAESDTATSNFVRVTMPERFEDEIKMLKELMWTYVILGDDLLTEQHGQKAAVRDVLSIMLEAARDHRDDLFPPDFRDLLALAGRAPNPAMERKRIAIDYVAGMTERELARKHRLLTRS